MFLNADLHIHGRYSAATSKNLSPKTMARGSREKGVDILATGDILHPLWRKEFSVLEETAEGTYMLEDVHFILETEVEDINRVHHLLLFPSISAVEDFAERTDAGESADGRPHISKSGEELAEAARDLDALIGPCHAFTPWTALYASHTSISECYGSLAPYVSFLELGLSADTDYGDRISELHRLSFLTNSDAHSPAPLRLAREFNRLEIKEPTFREVKKAILRQGGRNTILNVGLPPQEGKYNETACIRCYRHVSLEDAQRVGWRCTCGGTIKKGVKDRVEELADRNEPEHPFHRPPYLHIIPLGEILSRVLGAGPSTKRVLEVWQSLVSEFGSEVSVLVDADIDDICKRSSEPVAEAIQLFRDGRVKIIPGGGGQYGKVLLDGKEDVVSKKPQKCLFDF